MKTKQTRSLLAISIITLLFSQSYVNAEGVTPQPIIIDQSNGAAPAFVYTITDQNPDWFQFTFGPNDDCADFNPQANTGIYTNTYAPRTDSILPSSYIPKLETHYLSLDQQTIHYDLLLNGQHYVSDVLATRSADHNWLYFKGDAPVVSFTVSAAGLVATVTMVPVPNKYYGN
jgi:hypothetical protein